MSGTAATRTAARATRRRERDVMMIPVVADGAVD